MLRGPEEPACLARRRMRVPGVLGRRVVRSPGCLEETAGALQVSSHDTEDSINPKAFLSSSTCHSGLLRAFQVSTQCFGLINDTLHFNATF